MASSSVRCALPTRLYLDQGDTTKVLVSPSAFLQAVTTRRLRAARGQTLGPVVAPLSLEDELQEQCRLHDKCVIHLLNAAMCLALARRVTHVCLDLRGYTKERCIALMERRGWELMSEEDARWLFTPAGTGLGGRTMPDECEKLVALKRKRGKEEVEDDTSSSSDDECRDAVCEEDDEEMRTIEDAIPSDDPDDKDYNPDEEEEEEEEEEAEEEEEEEEAEEEEEEEEEDSDSARVRSRRRRKHRRINSDSE